MRQAAEVAEDDRRPERLGQASHRLVERRQNLGSSWVVGEDGRPIERGSTPLAAAQPLSPGAGLGGDPPTDPVEPAPERITDADRPGATGQDQEGGLEGVVGVGRVEQGPAADAPDQRAVPGHESFERHLRRAPAARREPGDEFAVGQARDRPAEQQVVEVAGRGARVDRHDRRSLVCLPDETEVERLDSSLTYAFQVRNRSRIQGDCPEARRRQLDRATVAASATVALVGMVREIKASGAQAASAGDPDRVPRRLGKRASASASEPNIRVAYTALPSKAFRKKGIASA